MKIETMIQPFRFTIAEIMVVMATIALACRWPILLCLIFPAVIHYAAFKFPPAEKPGSFFRYAVPIAWLVAAWQSWHHPGDEYGMFLATLLPVLWVIFALDFSHLKEVVAIAFAAGVVAMAITGWGMDRMRMRKWPWLILYVGGAAFFVVWSISQYPSYQRAMSKNGSLMAYVSFSANFALYGSSLLCLFVTATARGIRRIMSR